MRVRTGEWQFSLTSSLFTLLKFCSTSTDLMASTKLSCVWKKGAKVMCLIKDKVRIMWAARREHALPQ